MKILTTLLCLLLFTGCAATVDSQLGTTERTRIESNERVTVAELKLTETATLAQIDLQKVQDTNTTNLAIAKDTNTVNLEIAKANNKGWMDVVFWLMLALIACVGVASFFVSKKKTIYLLPDNARILISEPNRSQLLPRKDYKELLIRKDEYEA